MKNLLLPLLLVLTVCSACGGDDEDQPTPAGGNCTLAFYADGYATELADLTLAAETYLADPTTANCEAYRTTFADFIDFLRAFENCPAVADRAEYRQDLRDAEADLRDLEC